MRHILKTKTTEEKPQRREISVRTLSIFAILSLFPTLICCYMALQYVLPAVRTDSERILIITLLILSVPFAEFWLIKILMGVFHRIAQSASSVASGKLTNRISVKGSEELKELADSFNLIASRLEESIDALKESKRRLHVFLLRIGKAVTSFEDIEELLKLIMDSTVQALQVEKGILFLYDPIKNMLDARVSYSYSGEIIKNRAIKIGEGKIGQVAVRRKPYQDKFLLIVPLVYQSVFIGVMALENKINDEGFTRDDMEVFSTIAVQTSIALENARLHQDVEKTYLETMAALALAVEAKDPYTRGHSQRVADFAMGIADEMGINDEEKKELINRSALLHDIGKVGISESILSKNGGLSREEREVVNQHPVIGEGIVKPLTYLKELCPVIRHHHERFDGKGYPDGLSGKDIPLGSRILAVADTYDALTSKRPYRTAYSPDRAMEMIKEGIGSQFDGEIAEAFLRVCKDQKVKGKG